ncbi:MAG: helix-turn-helix transcriptional regulator [Thermodesulfobacteriota bacterium]
MKEKQLVNLLKAVDLLARPGGTTINEMAESLAIDRRAVYRVLDNLQRLQFPVYDDKSPEDRHKRWRLQPDYVKQMPNMAVPELKLNFSEMLALYLLKGEATLYKGTRLEAEAQSAFEKIGAFLPAAVFRQLDKIKTLFIPQSKFAKDYSGKEAVIDTLADAMLGQQICRVHYFSFSSERQKQYRIEPLHFFESNGGMYVFVRVPRYDAIRTLAVERIRHIEKTGNHFRYPENFDPGQLLANAFDIVYDDPLSARIWISADQAKYVRERKFFQNQNITENPDGSLTLEIETSGTDDLKRWVLSLGAGAEVLSPKSLRRAVGEEIATLAGIYESASSMPR